MIANVANGEAVAMTAEHDAARRELLVRQRALLRDAHGVGRDLAEIEAQAAGACEFDDAAFEKARLRLIAATAESSRDRLSAIQRALRRILAGEFGRCAECGRRLAPEVLERAPATERCAPCAQRRDGGKQRTASSSQRALPPELRDLPDEDVAMLVRDRLDEVAGHLWRAVGVTYADGTATLHGRVRSEDHRQIAEQIVIDRMGLEVVDELSVVPDTTGEAEPDDALDGRAEDLLATFDEGTPWDPPARPLPEDKVRRHRHGA